VTQGIPETSDGGGSMGLSWILFVLGIVLMRHRINAISSELTGHKRQF
jgi:hypothetical protein